MGAPVFFTSDTHFGHLHVTRMRGFDSVEAMDAEMIARWRRVVPRGAIVYHLGDFSLHPADRAEEILSQLTGNIVLVPGNHDRKAIRVLFPATLPAKGARLFLDDDHPPLWVRHFPSSVPNGVRWTLHGHTHRIDDPLAGDSHRETLPLPPGVIGYDVGVDSHWLAPVAWTVIRGRLALASQGAT
jgi:calcineurin-like phosphoesterase family protein